MNELDAIIDWTFRNKLRLNHSKTKAMVIGSRGRIAKVIDLMPFNIAGRDIGFVQNHLYLGVMINCIMSLSYLTKDIKKKNIKQNL